MIDWKVVYITLHERAPEGGGVCILVIVLVVMGRRPLTVHVSTRPWTVSTTATTIIVEGRPNKTR